MSANASSARAGTRGATRGRRSKTDLRRARSRSARGDLGQARAQRLARARTAAPFRSEPLDAAVADVLGTLSVRVGMIRTAPERQAERVGGNLPHLGVQPWPISVPPWFTCTLPSW